MLQFPQKVLIRRSGPGAATAQRHPSGPLGGEPFGDFLTQATKSPGDQIAGIRADVGQIDRQCGKRMIRGETQRQVLPLHQILELVHEQSGQIETLGALLGRQIAAAHLLQGGPQLVVIALDLQGRIEAD